MLTLVMGNKNYSSWSVRPWFFMRHANIPFEERVFDMESPSFASQVTMLSPSRRVPALLLDEDEDDCVWDSLAIGEYLAETFPEAGVWPADATLRRLARSACAEMHAGFGEMRRVLTCNHRKRYPVDFWRKFAGSAAAAVQVSTEVSRVHDIWRTLLLNSSGPFLCGATPSFVDAFYAPVVSRFATYALSSPDDLMEYRARVEALPTYARWSAEAAAEPYVIPRYEYA